MNYLLYFIIILIIIILLQQHLQNIKPYQNNNALPKNNKKSKTSNKNSNSVNKSNAIEQFFQSSTDNNKNIKIANIRNTNSTSHKINHFNIPEDVNNVHSIQLKGKWKDQGWGNRKSILYLFFTNRKTNDTTEVLVHDVKKLTLASHSNVNINFTIYNDKTFTYYDDSPREFNPALPLLQDNNYSVKLRYIVGGGGGHRLYVKNINLNILGNSKRHDDFLEYKYSQSMNLKGTVESDENCSINYNSDFITTNGVDKKLFNLQYNYPITISFWANFEKLNNTNSLPYDLISYTNGSKSGWSLSVEINNRLKLDIKKNGNSIINGGLIFDYNIESDTSCFNYYLISFQGFKYINTNNYYVNTTSQFSEIKNQKTFNINFQPNYINYDNSFDNIPEILRDAFFDNITIDNDFRNELDNFSNTRENFTNTKQNIKESFITPNTNPANRIEPKKIEKIDTRSDYEKAKPYIDKIHKYGEFNSPLHNSLKNLQASFHKDFILKNDTKNFNKKIISEIDNHIYELNLENDETNKIKDGQNEKINNLEKSADILNTEIMISKNIDINPYQDKTIKSNNTGSIINHLDNVGNGSFLIRTNDKPGKCLYTSSYKNVSNNTKNCNADDLSQKVNFYDINEDTDYIQHLPKINNTTELHKISNHSEFKYPFKIVKSKNNDQCLHNYDINKYKFNECIPHLGQQFRMWDKETS